MINTKVRGAIVPVIRGFGTVDSLILFILNVKIRSWVVKAVVWCKMKINY